MEWLLLLKNYWYIAVFVVLGLIIGTQHLEINHYKTAALDAKTELVTYRKNAESTQAAWASRGEALSLKVKEQSIALLKLLGTTTTSTKVGEIRNDPVAKGIIVPRHVVQLFNESASDPTAQGTTSPIGTDVKDSTLAEFGAVCTANASEQTILYHQVIAWQDFWADYVKGVELANTQ